VSDRLLYTAEICLEKEETVTINTENAYVNIGGKIKSRDVINGMGGGETKAFISFCFSKSEFSLACHGSFPLT
jgi:hypothetical protein